MFAAERGVSSAEPALVRIHPVSGAQSVISSGGLFVEPLGVSLLRGVCAPVPLAGSALGVSGLLLYVRGAAQTISPFSNDPGLVLGTNTPASVPALPASGLGALAALLAAGGVLARRFAGQPR